MHLFLVALVAKSNGGYGEYGFLLARAGFCGVDWLPVTSDHGLCVFLGGEAHSALPAILRHEICKLPDFLPAMKSDF